MYQQLGLSAMAVLATAFGTMEGWADVDRGQALAFGPRRQNLLDGLFSCAIFVAFALSFCWIWQSWPRYLALGCLGVLVILSRSLVTRATIARWLGMRPAVATIGCTAAAILWLIFPPA